MDDSIYIDICLLKIEEKLAWGPSNKWTKGDFERMSDMISQQTGIMISSMTLKRLFGKAKTYKEEYKPQFETKNALAKFIGFDGWQDFVSKQLSTNKIPTISLHTEKRKKISFVWLILLFLFIPVVYFIYNFLKNDSSPTPILFKIENPQGKSPWAITVKYDISNIKNDSVFIDFGEHSRKYLSNNKKSYVFSYPIPGYYKVSLIYKNKEIAKSFVHILSDEWKAVILDENNSKYYFGESIIFKENKMHLDIKTVENKNIKNKRTGTEYFFVDTFGISADHFSFETKIKNPASEGGIPCYDFKLRMNCDTNQIYIHFSQPGCIGWVDQQFGDNVIEGSEQKLSAFGVDFNDWHKIKLEINNKTVKVYFDDSHKYSSTYSIPMGNIKNIRLIFNGLGSVDYVHLIDLNTSKTFSKKF